MVAQKLRSIHLIGVADQRGVLPLLDKTSSLMTPSDAKLRFKRLRASTWREMRIPDTMSGVLVGTRHHVGHVGFSRERQSAPACWGHPERDDNRVRGQKRLKGKIVEPKSLTKVEVSINLGRFTSKADIDAAQTDVCFVPKADISFDDDIHAPQKASPSGQKKKDRFHGGLSRMILCRAVLNGRRTHDTDRSRHIDSNDDDRGNNLRTDSAGSSRYSHSRRDGTRTHKGHSRKQARSHSSMGRCSRSRRSKETNSSSEEQAGSDAKADTAPAPAATTTPTAAVPTSRRQPPPHRALAEFGAATVFGPDQQSHRSDHRLP